MPQDDISRPTELANVAGIFGPDFDDPDQLPGMLPDGLVSFLGTSVCGSSEAYAIVEMKVVLGSTTIEAALDAAQARDLRAALDRAIEEAEESTVDFEAALRSFEAEAEA